METSLKEICIGLIGGVDACLAEMCIVIFKKIGETAVILGEVAEDSDGVVLE